MSEPKQYKWTGYRKCSKCGTPFHVSSDSEDMLASCPIDNHLRISGKCGGVLDVLSTEAEYFAFYEKRNSPQSTNLAG